MTFATDENTKKSVETFESFDTDTQLAILWFGYLDLKDKLNPGNSASAQESAEAFYDRIKAMPKDQQLQAQRDIASSAKSDISHSYTALSSSGRLDVWLRLAQGMEEGVIIQVPSDYQLPSNTDEFVNQIKQLDFEQRLDFMRSLVVEMGAK